MKLICISYYSTACSHYRHTEDMKIVVVLMVIMMVIMIIIIILFFFLVFFFLCFLHYQCVIPNSYSIAFALLNCKWSLSFFMPSDSDLTCLGNGGHKEQSWHPHAHGNKKEHLPYEWYIAWYILISIRNSCSKDFQGILSAQATFEKIK